MNRTAIRLIPTLALLAGPACYADSENPPGKGLWKEVSGTAIHYFDDVPGRNSIIHEATPTETGVNLRTTESVDLFGDQCIEKFRHDPMTCSIVQPLRYVVGPWNAYLIARNDFAIVLPYLRNASLATDGVIPKRRLNAVVKLLEYS